MAHVPTVAHVAQGSSPECVEPSEGCGPDGDTSPRIGSCSLGPERGLFDRPFAPARPSPDMPSTAARRLTLNVALGKERADPAAGREGTFVSRCHDNHSLGTNGRNCVLEAEASPCCRDSRVLCLSAAVLCASLHASYKDATHVGLGPTHVASSSLVRWQSPQLRGQSCAELPGAASTYGSGAGLAPNRELQTLP